MVAAEVSKIQKRLNGLLEKYKATADNGERRNLVLALRLMIAEIDLADASSDGKPRN